MVTRLLRRLLRPPLGLIGAATATSVSRTLPSVPPVVRTVARASSVQGCSSPGWLWTIGESSLGTEVSRSEGVELVVSEFVQRAPVSGQAHLRPLAELACSEAEKSMSEEPNGSSPPKV